MSSQPRQAGSQGLTLIEGDSVRVLMCLSRMKLEGSDFILLALELHNQSRAGVKPSVSVAFSNESDGRRNASSLSVSDMAHTLTEISLSRCSSELS